MVKNLHRSDSFLSHLNCYPLSANKRNKMIDEIFRILIKNDVPEDVVENVMDALILGLMGKLSPEEKELLKQEIESDFNLVS